MKVGDQTPSWTKGVDFTTITWAGASNPQQDVLTNDGLTTGTYIVTVRQSATCFHSEQYTFGKALQIVSSDVEDNACSGMRTGTITLKVDGGSGDYDFAWEAYGTSSKVDADGNSTSIENSGINNANGAYQAGLQAGYYFVTITDKTKVGHDGANCSIVGGPYLVGNHTTLSVITTDGVEQCVGSLDGS